VLCERWGGSHWEGTHQSTARAMPGAAAVLGAAFAVPTANTATARNFCARRGGGDLDAPARAGRSEAPPPHSRPAALRASAPGGGRERRAKARRRPRRRAEHWAASTRPLRGVHAARARVHAGARQPNACACLPVSASRTLALCYRRRSRYHATTTHSTCDAHAPLHRPPPGGHDVTSNGDVTRAHHYL